MSKASQQHGFIFEEIISSFLNLEKTKYTHKFDGIDQHSLYYSIKFSSQKNIAFSSARRNFLHDCDYCVVVGRYSQHNKIKKIKSVRKYLFNDEIRNALFPKEKFDEVCMIEDLILRSTKKELINGNRKMIYFLCQKFNNSHHIILNPKISSSGSQRRLQCSIKGDFLHQIDSEDITNDIIEYIGQSYILSPRRKRNEKKITTLDSLFL